MSNVIENIFEGWKAQHNESTPQTEGQAQAFANLYTAFNGLDQRDTKASQEIFDLGIECARESEKAGFVLGFKMALNLMHESGFPISTLG